jgi:4-amino-4-deoxychorismate lyase
MCRFIETICIRNGEPERLLWHNARLNRTRREVLHQSGELDLTGYLTIQEGVKDSLLKCRVTYRETIEKVEFEPYTIRPLHSLRLIKADQIDYPYKYAKRECLQALFAQRGDADDVLLVKDGLITDTSYANIIFRKGTKWYTPNPPLLPGTRRASYIAQGRIGLMSVHPGMLPEFEEARIINAMISLEDSPVISMENIRW